MYKELIKRLRDLPHLMFVQLGEHEELVYQAADAIEKLSKPNDMQPVVRCIKCKYYEGLACCKLIGETLSLQHRNNDAAA